MNMLSSAMARICAAMFVAAAVTTFTGCETKEKVLDIETPVGEVEVERDKKTGETDVEVNTDK